MNAGASVKIGQSIEVTQGRRYRFGVFARQNAGTEIQDPANTKFRIADGSDNLLAAVNYGPFTTTWQHVSMDWTASKNTVAKFQLTAFLKSGSMYFDDVYVVDITNETNIKGNADAITSEHEGDAAGQRHYFAEQRDHQPVEQSQDSAVRQQQPMD
jgi:hypothetical protein